MCKIDLKSAYRSVAIHPLYYCLTGFLFKFAEEDSVEFTGLLDTFLTTLKYAPLRHLRLLFTQIDDKDEIDESQMIQLSR